MIEPGKHKLTEALDGQQPGAISPPGQAGPPEPQGPNSTPNEVAEATRREQEGRSHGVPDREDYLVNVGRGHQTHG